MVLNTKRKAYRSIMWVRPRYRRIWVFWVIILRTVLRPSNM